MAVTSNQDPQAAEDLATHIADLLAAGQATPSMGSAAKGGGATLRR